jgi:hypothetical protein
VPLEVAESGGTFDATLFDRHEIQTQIAISRSVPDAHAAASGGDKDAPCSGVTVYEDFGMEGAPARAIPPCRRAAAIWWSMWKRVSFTWKRVSFT